MLKTNRGLPLHQSPSPLYIGVITLANVRVGQGRPFFSHAEAKADAYKVAYDKLVNRPLTQILAGKSTSW
jgi:hypothetical protein